MKLSLFVCVICVLVACYSCSPVAKEVKKENFTVAQLVEEVSDLEKKIASGNVSDVANSISSIAQVLNEEESAEDIKLKKELRGKLVSAVVDNVDITKGTSLADVSQIFSTLGDATAVAEENSYETTTKIANFMEKAGDAILEQAKEKVASSQILKEASEAVFSTAVNVILSADSSQDEKKSSSELPNPKESAQNVTRKAVNTIDKLASAILTTKIAGEKETTIITKTLAQGVSREKAIGLESIIISGGVVKFPDNMTAFNNFNTSAEGVVGISLTFSDNITTFLNFNISADPVNEFGNGPDLQKAPESQKRARRWVDVLSEINSVLEKVPNTRNKRSTDEDAHLKSLPQFPETDVAAADFAKVRHANNFIDKFEEK